MIELWLLNEGLKSDKKIIEGSNPHSGQELLFDASFF